MPKVFLFTFKAANIFDGRKFIRRMWKSHLKDIKVTTSGPMIRAVSIMLQNLPIMLFGISLIFYLLCQILCHSTSNYATNNIQFYLINIKLTCL